MQIEEFHERLNRIKLFEKNWQSYEKFNTFIKLLDMIKGTKLLRENVPDLLKVVDTLQGDGLLSEKSMAFHHLLDCFKGIVMTEEEFSFLLNWGKKYSESENYYIQSLIDVIKGTKLLEEKLPLLIDELDNIFDKFKSFCILVEKSELVKKCYSIFKTRFIELLNDLDNLPEEKYYRFSELIKVIKGTDLIQKSKWIVIIISLSLELLC
jgi:hypothetical protein